VEGRRPAARKKADALSIVVETFNGIGNGERSVPPGWKPRRYGRQGCPPPRPRRANFSMKLFDERGVLRSDCQ